MNDKPPAERPWLMFLHALGAPWLPFIKTISQPLVLGLLTATFWFGLSVPSQKDPAVIALLTVLVGLLSSVWGGVAGNRWMELTGERVIVARGRTAVRSLKLLLADIIALERRLATFMACHSAGDASPELLRTYLDETADRSAGLERAVLSSIDNWIGIVPDAAPVVAGNTSTRTLPAVASSFPASPPRPLLPDAVAIRYPARGQNGFRPPP